MKGLSEALQQVLANRLQVAGLSEYFSDLAVDLEGVPVKTWENASAVGTIVSLTRAAKANETERFNLARQVKELRDEWEKLKKQLEANEDEAADLALENARLKEDATSAERELRDAWEAEEHQEQLASLYRSLFENVSLSTEGFK